MADLRLRRRPRMWVFFFHSFFQQIQGQCLKLGYDILRCVIPVVLSNNKNKLLVHMYIVKNTTVFLIVRLLLLRYNYMFRPSMLAIFRLYMKHLTISYVYT
jgi:hypothetical protein